MSNLPDRLVIEALINLLRATWIEVRSTDAGVVFAATDVGKKLASQEVLPAELQRTVRWTSLCLDRLTGSWLRTDDSLELVHDRDLPDNPYIVEPKIHTYDPNDGAVRDFLYLSQDESLEPSLPNFKTPARVHARVEVAFGKIVGGLPSNASVGLQQAVLLAALAAPEQPGQRSPSLAGVAMSSLKDTIGPEDIIVGGPEHLELLKGCFADAKSHLVLHSCFVSPDTIMSLLPDIEKATKRKVQIDLLWGLHSDPESPESRKSITDADKTLDALPNALRSKVQLSPISSGSHAKVIVYDDLKTGRCVSVVGSCNFLSTQFDWIEASIRSRSLRLGVQLMGRLVAAQLPAAGTWSATARRLNRLWSKLRRDAHHVQEHGDHQLTLISDGEHYACITAARDAAKKDVVVGCDLYGLAAETSVLVPMTRVAELNRSATIIFNRPSKLLRDEGRPPDAEAIGKRGIKVMSVPDLHAKFLCWDSDALVLTSFNWLATVADGTRSHGAELGVLVEGSGLREIFAERLRTATGGRINIGEAVTSSSD